jgi:two-component system, NarL family, invasion response regulator UvrY
VETSLQVLITDDNPIFRQALADVLAASDRFRVIAETSSGEEAIELVGRLRPSLVVMDINLPSGIDGIDAAEQLRHLWPGVAVVLISTVRPDELPVNARACGAVGYLAKDELTPEALFNIWERSQEADEPAQWGLHPSPRYPAQAPRPPL